MEMQRVRVGVIGLGEVAQIIHLPILEALADRFAIGAICDISPGLLALVGDRYGVERRYDDPLALVRQPDLDAVFVLNSDEYHADCTIAALRNGKHVLVEKPMCLTLAEAEQIIAARDAAGVQVMVAYMRRFAPAFVQAVREVRALGAINYARPRHHRAQPAHHRAGQRRPPL
jgi:predicted dehydrogenase